MTTPVPDRDLLPALRDADEQLLQHARQTTGRDLVSLLRSGEEALSGLPPPPLGDRLVAALDPAPVSSWLTRTRWAGALALPAALGLVLLFRNTADETAPNTAAVAAATATTQMATTLTPATAPTTTSCAVIDGVATASVGACVVHDEGYVATLSPGARVTLGARPTLSGEVSVRPTKGSLVFAMLDARHGLWETSQGLRLRARPRDDLRAVEVEVVEGSARAASESTSSTSVRLLAVGQRIVLPPAPVAASSLDGALPETVLKESTGKGPTSSTSATAMVTDDGLAPLLAAVQAARSAGNASLALRLVDEALPRARGARVRVVLGFERARLLAAAGDDGAACAQLAALQRQAKDAAYGDEIVGESERLGCPAR
jgi:hypothetical protein